MFIHFARNWATGGWDIHAGKYVNQDYLISYKITVEETTNEYDPTKRLETTAHLSIFKSDEVFKALIAGLQEAGLMPKMGSTEAELIATKRHLEDMRSLAFESLPPKELK